MKPRDHATLAKREAQLQLDALRVALSNMTGRFRRQYTDAARNRVRDRITALEQRLETPS